LAPSKAGWAAGSAPDRRRNRELLRTATNQTAHVQDLRSADQSHSSNTGSVTIAIIIPEVEQQAETPPPTLQTYSDKLFPYDHYFETLHVVNYAAVADLTLYHTVDEHLPARSTSPSLLTSYKQVCTSVGILDCKQRYHQREDHSSNQNRKQNQRVRTQYLTSTKHKWSQSSKAINGGHAGADKHKRSKVPTRPSRDPCNQHRRSKELSTTMTTQTDGRQHKCNGLRQQTKTDQTNNEEPREDLHRQNTQNLQPSPGKSQTCLPFEISCSLQD
jgi:hypothetical protein